MATVTHYLKFVERGTFGTKCGKTFPGSDKAKEKNTWTSKWREMTCVDCIQTYAEVAEIADFFGILPEVEEEEEIEW